jgi:hypothetical protein
MPYPFLPVRSIEIPNSKNILVQQEHKSHTKHLQEICNKKVRKCTSEPALHNHPANNTHKKTAEKKENREQSGTVQHGSRSGNKKKDNTTDRLRNPHHFCALPAHFFKNGKINSKLHGLTKRCRLNGKPGSAKKPNPKNQNPYRHRVTFSVVRQNLPLLRQFNTGELEHVTANIVRMVLEYHLNSKDRIDELQPHYPHQYQQAVSQIFEKLKTEMHGYDYYANV